VKKISPAIVVLLGSILILPGCATFRSDLESANNEKDLLAKRVLARWNAIIKRNYDHVYDFATPTYRKTFSKEHFFNNYAAQLRYEKAEIREIQFKNPEKSSARVVVDVTFTTQDGQFQLTSPVVETWIKEDGEWWHVEPR